MENLDDLRAFVQVATCGSFTKAAARLGITQSTLSHSIKMMEERLGVKLFNRTTRSIAPTAAGEQLLHDVEPLIAQIEQKLSNLNDFRSTPRGLLRINASEIAARYILWPKLGAFLRDFPEVSLEIACEVRYADIVAERFDAGVRLGSLVDKDMVAVRISPDVEMCVLASPAYLAAHGTPHSPDDLEHHTCLAMRLPTHSDIMGWEFTPPQGGKSVRFQPRGRVITNNGDLLLQAVADGQGLSWLPRFVAENALSSGQVASVLDDWAMRYPGYHLYYPHRRTDSPLFQALVANLRDGQSGKQAT